ncbi:MAG TPA: SAM-dependent methyltransferase [Terriglobales bacterium]|nr:SAM-dependent methyltransferase [Terriglobales bacterium]
MNTSSPLVRDVSDTARWVAYFRARESERPDALFRDPYAERLAGKRGFEIANKLHDGNKHDWAWVARTCLFDRFISHTIQHGPDMVVSLAAGLDARPYRMQLPEGLQWVEVDLPEVISYKEEVLANEIPRCRLERIALDLSDIDARRALFANLNHKGSNIVVMTEGFLIYLDPEDVASLARDLAAASNFKSWLIDLASPGQLKLMQRTTGRQLSEAGAPFKFGPREGADFFVQYGWTPKDIQGMLKTAAEMKRAPAELLSLLPEPKKILGNYPWTGVGLLQRVRVECTDSM